MKKLISVVLLLAMVLGLFAGCGKDKEAAAGLQSAAEYLTSMYQTAAKDEAIVITTDQDVLKSVVVDGVSYAIAWAVEVTEGDADSVTVAESTKENHVKLDIPCTPAPISCSPLPPPSPTLRATLRLSPSTTWSKA